MFGSSKKCQWDQASRGEVPAAWVLLAMRGLIALLNPLKVLKGLT